MNSFFGGISFELDGGGGGGAQFSSERANVIVTKTPRLFKMALLSSGVQGGNSIDIIFAHEFAPVLSPVSN